MGSGPSPLTPGEQKKRVQHWAAGSVWGKDSVAAQPVLSSCSPPTWAGSPTALVSPEVSRAPSSLQTSGLRVEGSAGPGPSGWLGLFGAHSSTGSI